MRKIIVLTSIIAVFILSFFIFYNIYFISYDYSLFFEKKEDIEVEIKEFNEEFLKKGKYNIFCNQNLENGKLSGDDYFSLCKECINYCPKIDFYFSILNNKIIFSDLNNDKGKEAIMILEKKVGEEPSIFFLAVLNSSFQEYNPIEIGKGIIINYFTAEKDKIIISFLNHKETDLFCCPTKEEMREYKIIGDNLVENKILEKIKYRNIEKGFQFEYPENWEVKKINEDSFMVYNSSSFYNFPIFIEFSKEKIKEMSSDFLYSNLENFLIKTRKETPYKDIFEGIKSSFKINNYSILSDYSYFKNNDLKEKTFLEVDAEEMKIFLNKDGKVEKEYNILAKGDYEKWGGAPAGLYSILSKQKLGFSNISNAYMPYAARIYGSYLIHGEPYYSGGIKINSPFSGGCFRVKNEEMTDLFSQIEVDMPILVIDKKNDNFRYKDNRVIPFIDFTADKYLVADLNSGFVILEKEIEKEHQIGSLTKLMTSLIMVENADINKTITAKPHMFLGKDSSPVIFSGYNYKIADLFVPSILGDENNSIFVLSHYFGIEETLKKMNEKTRMIMMEKTFFSDPIGEGEENVSTAKDLFYLTRYIRNNTLPLFQISKGNNVLFVNKNIFPNLKNKNLFYEKDDFIGGKKGTKNNGIFIFNIWGRDIAFIILGSKNEEQMKKEVEEVIKWIENSVKY